MRYTRRQRVFAAIGAVLPVGGWLVGGSIAPGCGGSQGASTPLPATTTPRADPGSGPFDCNAGALYDFHTLEDFEFGAATGWFTNNEVCYPWTQAAAECADAGMVCYPGSQATPECKRGGAPVGVWSACFGSGSIDCSNADAALAACQAECLSIQPSPPLNADQLPAEPIPNGGRCGSFYAMHVRAGPFSNWGGNVGTRFAGPVDVSNYDGIAVWMRTAPGFANNAKIAISDRFTDSQFNMYPVDGGQQYCDPNPNCQVQSSQGNSNCYNVGCDKFSMYTPLIEDWRLFLLPFAEMRQGGWGRQRPQPDLTAILGVEIDYVQGTWDFWVDDISFYSRKAQ